MTDVIVIDKDVVVEVKQPTVPAAAQPPKIGLVEINQLVQRGSIWSTGHGAPTLSGGQTGDMYLDVDTGDIYRWDGVAWVFQGTFAPATLTPAEILAALITVDGAGSNLDADLLDGQHGAYYAKQSDMTTQTSRNDTQDTQIAANTDAIAFNATAITNLDNAKAPKDSPTFTGDPKAPTPAPGDNDTSIATTAYVQNEIAVKAPVASPTFTGDPKAPTPTAGDNDTSIATTAFVQTEIAGKAPIASPSFTGDPKAPTPSPGDNDTSIATTAFVAAALAAGTLPADILAKLLTVDGAGSNLDADLLDGQHGAYYLDLSHSTNVLPPARFSDASHGTRAGGNLHPLATSLVAGFMVDAPSDSFVYGRKNGAWATVIGGATTDDLPPAGPLQDGQLWWKSSTGVLYLWYADANSSQWVQVSASPQVVDNNYARKTAQSRNRVVNGAMQISQENGNSLVNTSGAYAVDQFFAQWNGAMVLSQQRKQIVTPKGSRDRLQITVSTVDAAIAAGEYALVATRIEGGYVADFCWGTAQAQQAVVRFGFKGPAGTYHVVIQNNGNTRSYVAQMVISGAQANTDTEQVFIIPGDVTGTWAADNSVGLHLYIVLATGSTYQGALGWQAGNIIGTSAQSNGVAAANVFELFDVGLYLDPDDTGLPPPWQAPDPTDEQIKCMRYWEYLDGEGFGFSGNATSASGYSAFAQYRVPKRATPILLGTNASAVGFPTTVGATAGDVNAMRENRVATATGAVGFRTSWQANARM